MTQSASLHAEATQEHREQLALGTSLRGGRYTIKSLAGRGGDGIVYRALDRFRGREVALKILHLDDEVTAPRLKQEFRFLRDLIHPGLVQLYELDLRPELSFFTMSLVEGVDFLEAVDSGSQARFLFTQLAEVVSFLHQTKRLHRDIKPNNILVKESGDLVLLDFGIGIISAGQADSKEVLIGTPRYMAPEILNLEPASEKSDAYSMGVLLYEALAGEAPLPRDHSNLYQKEPFDPSQHKEGIADDLCQLTRGLTHPDPKKRSSAEDALEVLASYEEFSPHKSRRSKQASIPPPKQGSYVGRKQGSYVGRKQEFARLDEAFKRVSENAQTVLVQMEARSGMGKTSTLTHFLASKPNALVFQARCSEDELVSHNALDGIVEDLIEFLMKASLNEALDLLPLGEAHLLMQLFPELKRVPAFSTLEPDTFQTGDYRALRHRTYQALGSVFTRISSLHSLIIAIDDLQWGDLDSGKLLYEIFSASAPPSCLLLLAYRSEEKRSSACLDQLLYQASPLSDRVASLHLHLSPLGNKDARTLFRSLADDPELSSDIVESLITDASGSPLLLTELASYLQERPEEAKEAKTKGEVIGIDRIVRSRFERLSQPARLSFGLLCCSGSALDLGFLAELSCGEPEAISLELEASRLACGREGRTFLSTLHDAIREAHLHSLGDEEKKLNLLLAEGLLDRNGDAAEIARHFHAADDPRASDWAADAARAASLSFALAQSVELYRLALLGINLKDGERLNLREGLADALADSGRGGEAAPLYAELAKSAPVDKAIEFRRRAAEQWLITGDVTKGTAVLIEVQKEVGLTWPTSAKAAFQSLLYHRFRLKFEGKGEFKTSLNASPSRADKRRTRQLAACRAAWPVSFISTIHGAANSSRYVRLALKSKDRQHTALGLAMEAMYHAASGPSERTRAQSLLEGAERLNSDGATDYSEAFMIFARGQCEYLLGDISESLRYYSDAEVRFLRHCRNVSWELNSGRIFWADALFYLGRHQEFDRRIAEWLEDAAERGDSYLASALLISSATRKVMKTGDKDEALRVLQEGAAAWNSPYVGYHKISEAVVRTHILIHAGQPQDALKAYQGVNLAMRKSFLNQVHVARVQTSQVEAVALLECAVDTKVESERRIFLQKARVIARRMHREKAPWTSAFSMMLESVAALIERPTESALEDLVVAGKRFSQQKMLLHAAAVDARVGELVGGSRGLELKERARRAYSDSDFADWTSAIRCHIPRVMP